MDFTNTKAFRKFQSIAMNGSLKVVVALMRFVPRPLIVFFVEGMFFLGSFCTKKLNKICVTNLHRIYGEAKTVGEYEKTARHYIKFIGHSMMDLLYYIDRPQELEKIVHIHNEEHLKKALEQGRGVIGVTAHLSNFPILFIYLAHRGYKINIIIRRMRDETFGKFMQHDICDKRGIKMIQTSPPKQFLKESLGALRRNEVLFILLDEVVAKEDGVEVDFLGEKVTRAPGPTLFFKRTRSPIVPVFISQDERKHYKIFVEPVFDVHEGGAEEEDLLKNIGGMTLIIESYVKKYPLQWGGWLNKRWAETIPESK